MAELEQDTNRKQDTTNAITRRNLLKGLIAGAAGGVVGAGVKLICEQIAPPRAPGREPPPGILVSNILQARRGHGLDHAGKQKSAMIIHWTFSTLSSAAYGAAAEFFPWVTAGYGTFVRLGAVGGNARVGSAAAEADPAAQSGSGFGADQ